MDSRSLHQIRNCVLPDSIISKKFGGEKILASREDAAEINRIVEEGDVGSKTTYFLKAKR